MKPNAIQISDTIEKVYVDFSSLESLEKSTGFNRLYTIHTKELLEMSNNLLFHVGGFCDDRGNKDNYLAGSISGYGVLPSDLILCLMDDRYNFLPLNEEQLDKLYKYLIDKISKDAPEEVIDNSESEDDDLLPYMLDVIVKCNWPNQKETRCEYNVLIPLLQMNADKPHVPYFSENIDVIAIDRIHDIVSVGVDIYSEYVTFDLKPNEEKVIPFKFFQVEDNPNSLREGTITIRFEKHLFVYTSLPNKTLQIKEKVTYLETGKEYEDIQSFKRLSTDEDVPNLDFNKITTNSYFIWIINDKEDLVVVVANRHDYQDQEKIVQTFIPVRLNKDNIFIDKWDTDDGLVEEKITLSIKDGN